MSSSSHNIEIKIPNELSTSKESNMSVKEIHDAWREENKKYFQEVLSKEENSNMTEAV